MEKAKIIYDENKGLRVHELPSEISNEGRAYGLGICYVSRYGGIREKRDPDETLRYFEFYCLSHLLDGRGCYRDEETPLTSFGPGRGVLVTPGHVHSFGCHYDVYRENSICFLGPIADRLKEAGVIRNGICNIGKSDRLTPIIRKAQNPSPISQIAAIIALQQLLLDLHDENRQPVPTDDILDQLLAEIRRDMNKWWTVKEMASFCGMSEVHFRLIFRRRHQMAPKRYIDLLKHNEAADRLSDPGRSIAEVAESLGYLDQFHFSRRFKQLSGSSPRDYRNKVLRR